jgi:transcriptional regulator with XRE-family HTH domain
MEVYRVMYFQVVIKDLMKRKRMTIDEFAEALHLSAGAVLGWLTGYELPTDKELLVLSLCFGKNQEEWKRAFELLQRIRDVDSRRHLN